MIQTNKPVCVIVGVGEGNGTAFARKFTFEGYQVALLARSLDVTNVLAEQLDGARAYKCDVTDACAIESTFAIIRSDMGEIDVLVYNSGSGVWGNIEEVSQKDFEQSWQVNALGAFLVSKQVIPTMKQNKKGNIIFIGATASRLGGAKTTAFAGAKAAQKSLAESMARYLCPFHVHVAIVIIDAIVDIPSTRKLMPDKPDTFFIKPEDIADTVFGLTQQKSSAWSFEIEVRPFGEQW